LALSLSVFPLYRPEMDSISNQILRLFQSFP
jgi:hypothetical protein